MTTLFNTVRQGLTISGFDAIMLVRNGAVMVNGIVVTDPVKIIDKPATLRIGNKRLWVSPTQRRFHEQETLSQPDQHP